MSSSSVKGTKRSTVCILFALLASCGIGYYFGINHAFYSGAGTSPIITADSVVAERGDKLRGIASTVSAVSSSKTLQDSGVPGGISETVYRQRLSAAFRNMETRGELPKLLNNLGLLGEGVEVGVRNGEYSLHMLKYWAGKKWHMVDPWEHQDEAVYKDISNRDNAHQQKILDDLVKSMQSNHPGRYEFHRGYSVQKAKQFADESLDCVYLDARHDYAGVKEDLEAWWPKLKIGGLFAGHDFVPDGHLKAGDFGVQKAVWEFAKRQTRTYQSISSKDKNGGRSEPQWLDGGWTTWYLIK